MLSDLSDGAAFVLEDGRVGIRAAGLAAGVMCTLEGSGLPVTLPPETPATALGEHVAAGLERALKPLRALALENGTLRAAKALAGVGVRLGDDGTPELHGLGALAAFEGFVREHGAFTARVGGLAVTLQPAGDETLAEALERERAARAALREGLSAALALSDPNAATFERAELALAALRHRLEEAIVEDKTREGALKHLGELEGRTLVKAPFNEATAALVASRGTEDETEEGADDETA